MSLRLAIPSIALVGFLGLCLSLCSAQEEAEVKGIGMEHMELAQAIVRALGLQGELPVNATAADYASYLQGRGVSPMRGWIAGAEVTREDLAVVAVEGLGLADEVEDPTSVASYMAVLDERQISVETVRTVISNVTVRAQVTSLVLYSPITVLYETYLSPVEGR